VYATVEELQGLLRITNPSALQTAAMERVLDAAATEIDWELGYNAATPAPDPPPPLVVEVNLERAIEHWKQTQSPHGPGILSAGSDMEPIILARNTWYRHHLKLAPLKVAYGVA
jgi:hypothetical protein